MKVEILFPEICCLFGDKANVRYLSQCDSALEIVETSLTDDPLFLSEEVALVYMGSTSESGQEKIIEKLLPYKKKIKSKIEAGQLFLMTGNAMEVFYKEIIREDDSKIDGLGIFEFTAKRFFPKRYNSLYLGTFEGKKVTGYTSRFSHTVGKRDATQVPLFKTIRGTGLNLEDQEYEGFVYKEFYGTYLLGPILIQNPYFTKVILRKMGAKLELAYEKELMEAYEQKVKELESDIVYED